MEPLPEVPRGTRGRDSGPGLWPRGPSSLGAAPSVRSGQVEVLGDESRTAGLDDDDEDDDEDEKRIPHEGRGTRCGRCDSPSYRG